LNFHVKNKGVKTFLSLVSLQGDAELCFLSPQPDTRHSYKTIDTGLVPRVVCPFTPQILLMFIKKLQGDGTLSWCWFTVASHE